ncbi:unnamed protein product [Hermetia illucens]|uniref:Cuticle protein 6 n=1 Tax=Hermetia illucens TaxID=343691 RepID=A0A7R8UN39_HERIL|nr:unnamed protein product [Hermetia illucens]
MKIFIALIALWGAVSAVPTLLAGGPTYYTETIPLRTQFVAQDAIGQYSYGYTGDSSARSETKSLDGVTRGAYSYLDADGKLQSVEYTADAVNGFRAAATNLPTSPVDDGIAPEPVQETEEVAKARAEHLAAFKEAEIRAAAAPEEPEEEEEEGTSDGIEEMSAQGAIGGEAPASTSAVAPGTITVSSPIAAIQAVPAIAAVSGIPALAVRTLESPVSSAYSYQVETNSNPSYSYSVATPLYSAPLKTVNTLSYAAAPVIARSRVDVIGDRHIDINGHLAAF